MFFVLFFWCACVRACVCVCIRPHRADIFIDSFFVPVCCIAVNYLACNVSISPRFPRGTCGSSQVWNASFVDTLLCTEKKNKAYLIILNMLCEIHMLFGLVLTVIVNLSISKEKKEKKCKFMGSFKFLLFFSFFSESTLHIIVS